MDVWILGILYKSGAVIGYTFDDEDKCYNASENIAYSVERNTMFEFRSIDKTGFVLPSEVSGMTISEVKGVNQPEITVTKPSSTIETSEAFIN